MGFVEQVLLSRQYQFINLSLGPDLPIEDTDVHAWTSVIDDLLSDGDTLMTVAIGNNGQMDRASGNARVQVPSDCVNALAVGAANDTEATWARAPYSAVGPGRSPGVIKPDLMAFGGNAGNYFHVLSPGKKAALSPQLGTSFASPYLLRSAVGIRAILGAELSPLAIKALLVHAADAATHDKLEVGWGKVPEDLMSIITCPEGVARVVYQGELKPGKYLRASLPLPIGGLKEKSMAAFREGISTVLIPEANKPDLYEVDEEVKKAVKFIPVSDLSQVLKHALILPAASAAHKRTMPQATQLIATEQSTAKEPAAVM